MNAYITKYNDGKVRLLITNDINNYENTGNYACAWNDQDSFWLRHLAEGMQRLGLINEIVYNVEE